MLANGEGFLEGGTPASWIAKALVVESETPPLHLNRQLD